MLAVAMFLCANLGRQTLTIVGREELARLWWRSIDIIVCVKRARPSEYKRVCASAGDM